MAQHKCKTIISSVTLRHGGRTFQTWTVTTHGDEVRTEKKRPHTLTSSVDLRRKEVTLHSHTTTMRLTVVINCHLFYLTVHGDLPT